MNWDFKSPYNIEAAISRDYLARGWRLEEADDETGLASSVVPQHYPEGSRYHDGRLRMDRDIVAELLFTGTYGYSRQDLFDLLREVRDQILEEAGKSRGFYDSDVRRILDRIATAFPLERKCGCENVAGHACGDFCDAPPCPHCGDWHGSAKGIELCEEEAIADAAEIDAEAVRA